MDFSFLHAADLHLDTPFSGLGAANAEVQRQLIDASLESWDLLVEEAIRREVAFVVLAGDLYDGAQRGVRAQFRVLDGYQRLAQAGIGVYVIHGNHDPAGAWSAIVGRTPPGVTVFGTQDVECVPVEYRGETVAHVYGISYATASVSENLALRYRRTDGPGIHIGVLHCNVGSQTDHGAYAPCTVDDLRSAGMDYWALGHIHLRSVLARDPWIVYAGNLQGRSPKPSEQGAKGAYVVHVTGGVVQEPDFVALDRVRFVSLAVDISDISDLEELRREIAVQVEQAQKRHEGRGLVVRMTIGGRGALHRSLNQAEHRDDFEEVVRSELSSHSPLLWIDDIVYDTRPDLDRALIRDQNGFSSGVIRRAEEWAEDGPPDVISTALRNRLRAIGLLPAAEELKVLVGDAEKRALELLEEEVAG